MIGLQVSVNGKHLYTAGIGDFGMMNAGVDWARIAQNKGTIYEHLWVEAKAYAGSPLEDKHWQNHALEVGDEVTIKVVQTDSPDSPLPGLPDFPGSETWFQTQPVPLCTNFLRVLCVHRV
jgi:hypothetical protein